jgi:IS5 family transposase
MDPLVPWSALLSRLKPYYPKSGRRGRRPIALESMLRSYCAQNWFKFSDRQMEDALYEIEPASVCWLLQRDGCAAG